jgi:hypothetical protein
VLGDATVEGMVCAHCKNESDPVTPENGVSVPDGDGNSVVLHNRCAGEWILNESEDVSA